MKKENITKISFSIGLLIELISLIYIKSFKSGLGISIPIYFLFLGHFLPQIFGAIGSYFSRYTKNVALWVILNIGLICSTLYFYISYLEVID